jgi:WD40 repeat protein
MAPQATCPDPSRLQQLLDGALPARECEQLQEHLGTCKGCQQALERLAGAPPSWPDMARDLRDQTVPAPKPSQTLRQLLDEVKTDSDRTLDGDEEAGKEANPNFETEFDFLQPSDRPGYRGRLGHYEVMALIGRGGMGVVFKAFDTVLQRVVAVKVLAPQLAANGTARRRFLREARAAAAVCHEHIVTIHAVEEQAGVPYIVMQYVAGISLERKISQQGPLEVKEVLRIGLQTAQGMAMAHANGLVHRDIKPANILLENGIEKVRITDFGLARAMDDGAVSQSGVVAGTPQYMAPEQARGEPVSPRADLFSLGGVLYAMCTGQPPFKGSNSLSILKRVCEENPRPIQQINRDVPAWLMEVIGKLMAKAADARYQTAAEVAELLQQHLAVLQQPTGVNLVVPSPQGKVAKTAPGRRLRRWPWAAAGAVIIAGVATFLLLGQGLFQKQPHEQLKVQPAPPEPPASFEFEEVQRFPHGDYIGNVALSPDGKLALTERGIIRVWDTQSGQELRRFERHNNLVQEMVFTSDSKRVLSVSRDGTCRFWEVDTGNELRCFDGHQAEVWGAALLPGDKQALTGGHDFMRLWNLETGEEIRRFEAQPRVASVAVSADGKRALSVVTNPEKVVRLWDLTTGEQLLGLEHPWLLRRAIFSPDGTKALTAPWDGQIILWDLKTGLEIRRFAGPRAVVHGLAFTPDGRYAVSASGNSVRLWDIASGKQLAQISEPGEIYGMALSRDGKYVLTNGGDSKIAKLYRLPKAVWPAPVN